FLQGTGRHAAMLGSIQNFLATPPASGSADGPASLGASAWPATPVATHAPTLDPTADCRNLRRFAWRAIGYTLAGKLWNSSGSRSWMVELAAPLPTCPTDGTVVHDREVGRSRLRDSPPAVVTQPGQPLAVAHPPRRRQQPRQRGAAR